MLQSFIAAPNTSNQAGQPNPVKHFFGISIILRNDLFEDFLLAILKA